VNRLGCPSSTSPARRPLEICRQGLAAARAEGKCDVVVFDTAGRLGIDEALMAELADIKAAVQPQNILLVVDAMIGQERGQDLQGGFMIDSASRASFSPSSTAMRAAARR